MTSLGAHSLRPSEQAGILTCLLLLSWILLGLTGHDPWKPDEAYSFGLVYSYSEGKDWVVPMLAQEPFVEKPPIYFLTGSFLVKALHPWLAAHEAARLASGAYMVLTFLLVGLTWQELWGGRAPWLAPLFLASSAELLIDAHGLLTDIAQLTGFALAFYGFALQRRIGTWGGFWIGAGAGLAFMSQGLLAPGCLGVLAAMLPMVSAHWRKMDYFRSLFIALLSFLPWMLIWPTMLYWQAPELFHEWLLDNNLGRFFGNNELGPSGGPLFILAAIGWTSFPAGPIALFGIWKARQHLPSRPEYILPLVGVAVIFTVLSLSTQARGLYVLPMLIPLSILAVPGLDNLSAEWARMLSRFSIALFFLLAIAIWVTAVGLEFSFPKALHERLSRFQPGYILGLRPAATLLALFLMAMWGWIAFRFHHERTRPLVLWVAGLTMVWGSIALLIFPYLDTGKSYRAMVHEIESETSTHKGCIASNGLGEPQRAMMHYFAGITTLRTERNKFAASMCDWLLLQGAPNHIERPDGDWMKIWEGSRLGDLKETFQLYRKSTPRHTRGASIQESGALNFTRCATLPIAPCS